MKSKWVIDLVDELMEDLSGRSGFDIDGLDDEVINEWKEEWCEIVVSHVTRMVKDGLKSRVGHEKDLLI